MSHLPYIAASYALFLGVATAYGAGAAIRLAGASRRLRVLDTRPAR